MKKSGVILSLLVISVLLVSIISVSLVSAGWFEDAWSKITGRVVDNETEVTNETEAEECAARISMTFSKEIYNTGEYGKAIIEVFDSQGNRIPNAPFYIVIYSEDYVELDSPELATTNNEGYVEESGELSQEPGKIIYKVYTQGISSCPGVEDIAEIEFIGEDRETKEEVGREEARPEPPEPEPTPEICAAKISMNFDKNVYYFEEEFKVVMEVFDAQGNYLSNYLFFIAIYRDGIWDTFTDSRTDESGYSIHEDRINTGDPLQLGENKFKIYTDIGGCNFVENFATIEIKGGEKGEEVCGIGTCVPKEPKGVEDIPEGFYSCAGCELENKCYPMTYRKEGKYCSDNYEFVNQVEEGMCDNDFECKSNVCVSGGCIEEGLMKKILSWFKKMFGGEEEEKPKPEVDCSKLLIEKNIGDYKYTESGYGDYPETQAPLYSEDGEQIGTIKCCAALYDKDGEGGAALVCPFDNRQDIENTLKWSLVRGEFVLEEYKDEKVYQGVGQEMIVWTNDNYAIVVGTGPQTDSVFPEDIADAYFKEYKNDLGDIEIPKAPTAYIDPVKSFLTKAEAIGELVLIDFETTAAGVMLENGDRVDGDEWMSLGVVFEAPSEDYLQMFGPMHPFNPLDKLSLSPGLGPFEAGGDTHDDLNIIFSEPVKAAGIYLLDLGDTDDRESITFLDANNNIIKKISPWPKSTFGNPAPGTFVSLIHEEGISRIEILENGGDGDDIAYDNLYFVRGGNSNTISSSSTLKSISLSSADVNPAYTVRPYSDSMDMGVNHGFEKAIQSGSQVIHTSDGGSIAFRMNEYNQASYAKQMFDIINTRHTRTVVFQDNSIGEETFCHTSPDFYERNQKYYYVCGFWHDKIYIDVQTEILQDSSDLAVEYLRKVYNKI